MATVSGVALGMIETRGLVPAIEAADAIYCCHFLVLLRVVFREIGRAHV